MYENVFQYVSPPIMPGVRKLAGVPHEEYRLAVDLDADLPDNFVYSEHPEFNRRVAIVPVMSATGEGVEGFGVGPGMMWRILIFLLIVAVIYYLMQQNRA